MLLDKPTVVVIIMFGLLVIASIIVYICRDEIFIRRQQLLQTCRLNSLRHYLPSNVVDIDTGTAECTVIDENEVIDENNITYENTIIFDTQIRNTDIV